MKLIKIGRTEGNDLVIKDDTTISRNHAEIFQDDEENIFLTDLNSSNGTFVNGNKLEDSIILKKKDIVKIGNTVINWNKHFKKSNIQEPIIDEKHPEKNEKILIQDVSQDLSSGTINGKSYYFFAIPIITSLIYIQFNYGINNLFFVLDIFSVLFIPSLFAFLLTTFSKIRFEHSLSILSIIIITVQHFIN